MPLFDSTTTDLDDTFMTDKQIFDADYYEMLSDKELEITTELTIFQAYEDRISYLEENYNFYSSISETSLTLAHRRIDELDVKLDRMLSRQLAYKAYTIKISRHTFKCI